MKITPSWTATFETNTQTLIQDAWQRMAPHLIWDNYMEVRASVTLRELYFWLIETARIYDEGQGGEKRFDTIAALYREIDNRNSGAALELTRNEIEDNMMASPTLKGMPALVYSANWAKQIGGAAAYRPQELLFNLLAGATSTTGPGGACYDGKAFFAADHPINPYKESSGAYANILTGAASTPFSGVMTGVAYPGACPIDSTVTLDVAATNLTNALAYVRSMRQPNGKPRNLRVTKLLHSPILRRRVQELLGTKFFAGVGAGTTENVISTWELTGDEATELTGTDYYLGCEMLPGESGAFVYQSRSPYVLTTYTPETQLQLQMRKKFTWSFDGRDAGAYGHPYLFHKVCAA